MSILRTRWFFWLYRFLPHRLFNLFVRWAMQTTRPRWFVRLVIRKWIAWRGIDMGDFVDVPIEDYSNVEAFFLRELLPGARPLDKGFVSPVDGRLMAYGLLEEGTLLQAKGQSISVAQMVNGSRYERALDAYEGGSYVTIFLTPNGYHRIHMPVDGTICEIQWLPGRYFPQNEDAIHYVPRIYERNERAVLFCERDDEARTPFVMVLIAASLVGGIHLTALSRDTWVHTRTTSCQLAQKKGDEIAHFSLGSTIVMLFPKAWEEGETARLHPARDVAASEFLEMGFPLLSQAETKKG